MPMTARFVALALSGLLIASCSDAPEPDSSDSGTTSDIARMEDLPEFEEDPGVDTPTEDAAEDPLDSGECRTLGCECDEDSDCNAGFCVRHPNGGQVCSEYCGEECSEDGYECRTLRDGGGDLVRYCVPTGDPYCAPCEIDADCLATDNLCIEFNDGDFCATGCADGEPCPDGASCIGVVVGDESMLVCAPDGNQCAPCVDGDEDGRGVGPQCLGFDCNDDDPTIFEGAPETCDGLDNDCDDFTDEDFTELGELCGTCDSGAMQCTELVATCVGDLGDDALNACGTCEVLDGALGDPCGACGHGALECGDDGLVCSGDRTNECGGCADLEDPPDGLCDSGCGAGTWACSASGESTFCDAEGANPCGGCATLPETIGGACAGACGTGAWACVDGEPNEVWCNDEVELNACGGCAVLDAALGSACGPCGLDVYGCDGAETLACSGTTAGNVCGGCAALVGAIGDACGPCAAVLECDGDEAFACDGDLTDSDSDTVCDADDQCPDGDDRLDADGDGIPDACDGPPPECAVARDCGVDFASGWSVCSGFSGTCDESGTHSRNLTSYECVAGVCSSDVATQTEACERSTSGATCGEGTRFTAWSSCGGFSSSCDETGTRTRVRTDYNCAGGGCGSVETTETEACGRSTGGATCGDGPRFGSWGSCGSFSGICGESGTRSRSMTTYACDEGACEPTVGSQAEACGRDTDGTTCDTTSYSRWGECGSFGSTCGESGTQSRTRTEYACRAGSCSSAAAVENQSCARDTDGDSCGSTEFGDWGSCRFSGQCTEVGVRTRPRTDYVCGAGTCGASESSQDDACSRDTDGQFCEDWPGCSFGTCSGGTCPVGPGCSGGRRCCEPGICISSGSFCP